MKFFRNAIILVVIGLIAGFSYWYFEVKKAKEKKEKEEKEALLFEQKDVNIAKIIITHKGDKKPIVAEYRAKKVKKKENSEEKEVERKEWIITSPVETKGDIYALENYVGDLKMAKRVEVIWDNLEKEKEYGLDDPELSVRFYYKDDDKERGVDFGIKTLDGKKVFAKVVGQNKIYAVEAGVYDSLDKSLFDLRDKTISPYGKEDIVSISLITANNTFTLKKEKDGWYFEPDRIKASNSRVELYEGHLRWGNFNEVVKERATLDDLKEYGLDKPRLIIKYGVKNGKDYIFMVGDPIKEGDVTYYYATRNTDQMIFEVTSDLVMKLDTTKFLLKDRHIFDFKYNDVNKVSLRNGEKTFEFVKKDETWYFADSNKKVEKDYKIDGIIRSLEDAEYEEFEPIKRGDPKYEKTGMDKPRYEVVLYFKDNREPLRILVSEKNEKTQRVYLSPDNGETAYYTFGYFVDNIPEKKRDLMGED